MDPSSVLLTDKVAIITGGGDGIGKGVALTYAKFGAHVVIADLNPAAGDAVAAQVRALGRKAVSIATDVRNLEQVKAMVSRTVAELGGADILVNNAGGARPKEFMEMDEARWRRSIELNLVGLLNCTHTAVKAMAEGGRRGAIINISSIEGSRAGPLYSVYSACKAAMENFTKTSALEFSRFGIRVNSIAPDGIDTPHTAELHTPSAEAALARVVPLGRMGVTDDVAGAAVYLASEMSAWVTGINIHVDGGTWASSGWIKQGTSWTLFPDSTGIVDSHKG
ncbi:MAG TPA: SDR family NAD(P)-dependent oxidoreductase [Candidatus Binataceae bacterium]|nr:SDR family NAD(P)-dependent oxidoreductase [Candidatus Binataceae bacterium]